MTNPQSSLEYTSRSQIREREVLEVDLSAVTEPHELPSERWLAAVEQLERRTNARLVKFFMPGLGDEPAGGPLCRP
jgi:hypothetical protein